MTREISRLDSIRQYLGKLDAEDEALYAHLQQKRRVAFMADCLVVATSPVTPSAVRVVPPQLSPVTSDVAVRPIALEQRLAAEALTALLPPAPVSQTSVVSK